MEVLAAVLALLVLGVFLWMAITLSEISRSVAALEARFRRTQRRDPDAGSANDLLDRDHDMPWALIIAEAEKLPPEERDAYWYARNERARAERKNR